MGDGTAVQAARSRLDELVERDRVPGIQYVVVSPEQILFQHAAGRADIAGERELGATTTMMAYSMSKVITAAAVLKLVDDRKMGLDDSISAYLEWQPYGPRVTVAQLLSHTSGVPNPIPLRWVHPPARHETFDEQAALAAVLAAHPNPSFPPGSMCRYSNLGYWLLGSIVERVSGEPLPAFVREHLFRPLGIAPHELGYVVQDWRDHAKGYLETYSWLNLVKRVVIAKELIGGYERRWLHVKDHYVNGPAFGGVIGTAGGFGTFLRDQLRPHSALFSDETRRLFYATQRTSGGAEIPMTLGWNVGIAGGAPFFYKEGGGGGFHSLMRAYPSFAIATVVMTNATRFDVFNALNGLDPAFLA